MAVISWGIPLAVIIVAMSIDRVLNVEEIPIDVTLLINGLSFMSFDVSPLYCFPFFAFCLRC